MWKNILSNWRVDCFIARSMKWCDFPGCSSWIHFHFYAVYFFSRKLQFFKVLNMLIPLRMYYSNHGKETSIFGSSREYIEECVKFFSLFANDLSSNKLETCVLDKNILIYGYLTILFHRNKIQMFQYKD